MIMRSGHVMGHQGFWARTVGLPELNNFPWEFLQAPFFKGMSTAPHWEATQPCSAAALGDSGVTLIAYWIVSALVRSRWWILAPSAWAVAGFTGGRHCAEFRDRETGDRAAWALA